MKNNGICLIIFFNIFLIVFIFICIEFYTARVLWGVDNIETYARTLFNTISVDEYFDKLYKYENIDFSFNSSFRKNENENSKEKPILLMGCSFTWGTGLTENETFSYKLAQATKRPIYNRAGKGWGLDTALYQLQREDLYKEMKEPEYIIYTFMNDQINRFDKFKVQPNVANFKPRYKLNADKLILISPKFTDNLYFVSNFQYNKAYRMNVKQKAKYYPILCKKFFIEAHKEMRKHWKNTKFVILTFGLPNSDELFMYDKNIWEDLRKEGFIVFSVDELTKKNIRYDAKYFVNDCGLHPSSIAWDEIIPPLAVELQL